MRAAYLPRARRRRRARVRLLWQWSLFIGAVLVLGGTTLGLAFAGSPEKLPAGSQIAGVDVSGLTPSDARAMLKQRSRELGRVPVVFTANGKRWRVKPDAVVAEVDWAAAVQAAQQQGEGFGPFRGLKRLGVRVFGGDVAPRARVYQAANDSYVTRFAQAVDRPRAEPYLRLRRLEPEVVPGHAGTLLDRNEAERVLVRSLTALKREPVALPLRADRPQLRQPIGRRQGEGRDRAVGACRRGLRPWHLAPDAIQVSRLLALPRSRRRRRRRRSERPGDLGSR